MTASLSIQELAQLVGAQVWSRPAQVVDLTQQIDAIAPLQEADLGSVSFLANPRYAAQAQQSAAGALLLTQQDAATLVFPPHTVLLVVEDPSSAFQAVALWFLGALRQPSGFEGIHPTAVIHETATLAEGVSVGPYAVLDAHVQVGAGSQIGAHVCIGAGTQIGCDCLLHPHCVVREGVTLQDRVILQPGAVIGGCGFGYLPSAQGEHRKIEHLGGVTLADDVEVGANSCIDRARFRSTVVGEGSKIDNLVQIGHNCRIGPHNLIVSQVGIAGSSSTGARCVVGGQAAIVGHIHLGDDVQLAARAAATKDLPSGPYSGAPAVPYREGLRQIAAQRQIPKLTERLRKLEKSLEALTSEPANLSNPEPLSTSLPSA